MIKAIIFYNFLIFYNVEGFHNSHAICFVNCGNGVWEMRDEGLTFWILVWGGVIRAIFVGVVVAI
jgi:hypothetical protein